MVYPKCRQSQRRIDASFVSTRFRGLANDNDASQITEIDPSIVGSARYRDPGELDHHFSDQVGQARATAFGHAFLAFSSFRFYVHEALLLASSLSTPGKFWGLLTYQKLMSFIKSKERGDMVRERVKPLQYLSSHGDGLLQTQNRCEVTSPNKQK